MKIIGYQIQLLVLATRRLISALTYFYKLKCISGPAQLTSMVPPPALPTPHQQSRAQQGDRHQDQLSCSLPVASPDYLDHSFPYCVLSCWNSLPVNTIQQRSYLKGLQQFKTMVYHHLLHNNSVQSTDLCLMLFLYPTAKSITFTLIQTATERYRLSFFFPFLLPFYFSIYIYLMQRLLGESKTIGRRRDGCLISTLPLHPFVVLSHPFSNCKAV